MHLSYPMSKWPSWHTCSPPSSHPVAAVQQPMAKHDFKSKVVIEMGPGCGDVKGIIKISRCILFFWVKHRSTDINDMPLILRIRCPLHDAINPTSHWVHSPVSSITTSPTHGETSAFPAGPGSSRSRRAAERCTSLARVPAHSS